MAGVLSPSLGQRETVLLLRSYFVTREHSVVTQVPGLAWPAQAVRGTTPPEALFSQFPACPSVTFLSSKDHVIFHQTS